MLEKMREIIAEQLNADEAEISEATSFKEDLGADSLAFVELVIAREDATGIHIEEEEASKLKTVADVLAYLESKQQ